ncbi:MAG: ABC transporter permease [Brevundimonas sp.]
MRSLVREICFFGRSPAAVAAIVVLALLASVSVAFGLAEVSRERASITRVLQLQTGEEEALRAYAGDAGTFAYNDFRVTWNAPSALAFAALGQRDTAPSILRVRPLALEAQIYENEQTNPELALPGRFDLAFVAIYLAPLVLIVLLHDLWSGEREAGRLGALRALPGSTSRVFLPRVLVRAGLVGSALLIPFAVGSMLESAPPGKALLFAGAIAGLVIFWTLLVVLVARFGSRSTVNAAALAGLWFALTLVGPAAANLVVNAAVPTPEGARLARENRDAVHGAWDLPRQATLDRFLALHPEWSDTEPMTEPFHWKWYFAFQHLGDVAVAELSAAYRQGVERRERLAGTAGWLMPPVGFQRIMHRVAETDVEAQLAYQDRVRDFHTRLRTFYYPYLFEDQVFGTDDYASGPHFDDSSPGAPKLESGHSEPHL